MNEFQRDLKRFQANLLQRQQRRFVRVVGAVHRSIAFGSSVTGAPGQPVDTGALRASFRVAFPTPMVAEITTDLDYAPIIEDNVRGATLRSTVGGFHSVKMTAAGFDRLVAAEDKALGPVP